MATQATMSIIPGDTYIWDVTVTDSLGSPYDLTGFTPRFTVKEDTDDVDASALIGPITGSITNASGGIFRVTLTNTQSDIATGNYYYDFQIDNGSSIVKTVRYGTFTVNYDVTDVSY